MAANVDHAAIQAASLPDLTAPEKGTLASKQPALTEDKTTFSDARGLDGSFKMPDLSSLKFVKGEQHDASKPEAPARLQQPVAGKSTGPRHPRQSCTQRGA